MVQYEYRVVMRPERDNSEALPLHKHKDWLDEQARDGWELVSVVRVVPDRGTITGLSNIPLNRFYFKRAYYTGELG